MHTTDQLNTALAGRYEIERRIGAGGMATVYLARDLRHHRKVALKVLSPELGAVLGPERFLGEIEVTANLHHPHLLPLFDSGEAGGLLFYVMPYIEGETLRARVERERQLTIEDAIRITCAIASALDYAHRHGVVHRDLKPENILLHDGQPLVMDFGIALAVSNAGGARITQTGLSLGTPQYMSPEQATGDRQIDGRSDIYSLGAVTYELLTGEPPHTGATVQAIIARVITDRARSMRSTRETIPEHVDAAVLRSLAKLPADRFATAIEFAEALSGHRPVTMPPGVQHPGMLAPLHAGAFAASAAIAPRRGPWREITAWIIAAGAIATLEWTINRPKPLTPYGEFRLELPDSIAIPGGSGTKIDVTRDGSQIVFVGALGSHRQLYIRRADDATPFPVRGSDSAFNPTFSPGGDWLIFGTSGTSSTLRKVPAVGGTPQRLADSVTSRASWGDAGQIVFVRNATRVYTMDGDGSGQRFLAGPDSTRKIIRYAWPEVLPGSRYALITFWVGVNVLDSARIGVISLQDGSLTDLHVAGSDARYAAPGNVLFGRPTGLLFSAPFSLSKRQFTGAATLLLEDLWQGSGGATEFAAADNGLLVHHGGSPGRVNQLVRVDSSGAQHAMLTRSGMGGVTYPRISPDGTRIAVSIGSNRGSSVDLWMFDTGSGALTRFTSDSGSLRAEWAPDGTSIFYLGRSPNSTMVRSAAADGSGSPTTLRVDGGLPFSEITAGPKGSFMVYRAFGGSLVTKMDLYVAPVSDPARVRVFLGTPAEEASPRVSPSGASLAYQSDETGRPEIYLRPLPGPGAATPVSINGGTEPVWSRDGKTVFYRTPDRWIMAATVDQATQRVLSRRTLFRDAYLVAPSHQNYDVFPNGDFIFIGGGPPDSRVAVTTDWKRLLQRRQSRDARFEQ